MYSRKSSGRPSDATVINAAGIRNVANVTSARSTRISTSRNGIRDRCGSCGNSELATASLSTCSLAAAANEPFRSMASSTCRASRVRRMFRKVE
jgi:hypothetical protein